MKQYWKYLHLLCFGEEIITKKIISSSFLLNFELGHPVLPPLYKRKRRRKEAEEGEERRGFD